MKINMDTYDASADSKVTTFEPLPEGTYTVKIDGLETRTSQNNNKYYSVTLVVQGGDHNGRHIWDRLMLMSKKASYDRFFSVLMAAGVKGDIDLADETMMNSLLVGKSVVVDVVPEEYNGTTKAKVVLYEPTQDTFDGVGKEDELVDDDIPF